MATLEMMTVPGSYTDIPGYERLALMTAMMDKNDFMGLPAHVMMDGGKVVGIGIVDPDGYDLYAKLWRSPPNTGTADTAAGFSGRF